MKEKQEKKNLINMKPTDDLVLLSIATFTLFCISYIIDVAII